MFDGLDAYQLLFVLISMLIGMSFHEAMHAFVGYKLGDDTAMEHGRVTLNPLAHIDILTTVFLPLIMIIIGVPPIFAAKPVPFNPYNVKFEEFGAALIGIAGPLTNLLLAVVGGLVFRSGLVTTSMIADFVFIFTLINVALFVFNMIPFPPLDGSRLLYAFAPEPLQRLMKSIESMGLASVFLFILIAWQFVGPVVLRLNHSITSFLIGVNF
ncbi:site-2 protease family protein [Candidatus Saccharibacteria bacterium]|nr:site-2 protease family protein [Candidatus Saccharibacteria bacterium]